MSIDKKTYKKYTKAHAPTSPTLKNCIWAFCTGGFICTIGQALIMLYKEFLNLEQKDASLLCSVSLIFVAVVLTSIGVFHKIAKHAGAGTLVPITGFANAVVSPAIDGKSEGYVLGIGAKIFTVAGPVLLYGVLSGVVYGTVYYISTLL